MLGTLPGQPPPPYSPGVPETHCSPAFPLQALPRQGGPQACIPPVNLPHKDLCQSWPPGQAGLRQGLLFFPWLFLSPVPCLPSPALTFAAETGSLSSTRQSQERNPRDTVQLPCRQWGLPPHAHHAGRAAQEEVVRIPPN